MENKLIIKTTVTESREVEKEISLPHYSKKGYNYFAIFGEKKGIRLQIGISAVIWTLSEYEFEHGEMFEAEHCTEQEFNEAYTTALERLSSDVALWISVRPLPQPEDYEPIPNNNSIDVNSKEEQFTGTIINETFPKGLEIIDGYIQPYNK